MIFVFCIKSLWELNIGESFAHWEVGAAIPIQTNTQPHPRVFLHIIIIVIIIAIIIITTIINTIINTIITTIATINNLFLKYL